MSWTPHRAKTSEEAASSAANRRAWTKSAATLFIVLSFMPRPSVAQSAPTEQSGVLVFRGPGPSPPGAQLTVHADSQGHFMLNAAVNGVATRFIVDTGATFVALSKRDATAVGIDLGQLVFNGRMSTANGEVKAAAVRLQEIRYGGLVMSNVPAVVVETLEHPLLGLSFLRRLKSYEMRGDMLTIIW
jgi:aspartyl protease family protein